MDALRTELKNLLRGGQAYEQFESIAEQFKPSERGLVPFSAEHSAWQIVEHVRLAQRDILDYVKNEDGTYKEKRWPDEYWPASPVPEAGAWEAAVLAIQEGIGEFETLLADPRHDLLVPFPWGGDHTLMREVLVAADHVAYHAGQLVELRRWIDSSA